jgi:signal transduction histidine kinase
VSFLLRLLRSFALRTALLTAAGVLGISALGLGLGWLRSSAALQQALDTEIRLQAEELLREWRFGGTAGLMLAVELRARDRTPSALLVQLRGPGGGVLAGAASLSAAPASLQGFATLTPADSAGPVRALGIVLPGGFSLIVAARMRLVLDTAQTLASTLLAAGGFAVLLALAFGLLTTWRLERRLRAVSAAAEAVMRGDLARRLPLSGAADEFDRLAATVNALLVRLESVIEGMRQVTVDVAHDLRGPLSRLRQRLEAALARPRDQAADAVVLEAALEELDTVLATFSALLRIAQLEAGPPLAGGKAPVVDLSSTVATLAEAYQVAAEEAGRTLTAEVAPDQRVHGDQALLRQMLGNLLDNALAHGGPHLSVVLRPGPVLEVADDGPGIPAEERPRVLRRFYRLDRSRGTPGSGLGLALVAAVARLHGAVPVLSDAEPGLRVTVDLSAACASA